MDDFLEELGAVDDAFFTSAVEYLVDAVVFPIAAVCDGVPLKNSDLGDRGCEPETGLVFFELAGIRDGVRRIAKGIVNALDDAILVNRDERIAPIVVF